MATNRGPKSYTAENIGRSVEHVRTGDVAEFIGVSALDPAVINICTFNGEDFAEVAAQASDWDLVY